MKTSRAAATSAFLALATTALGAGDPAEVELGVFTGFAVFDDYTSDAGALQPEDDSLFGLRLGVFLGESWSLEASGQRLSTRTGTAPNRAVDIDSLRLGVIYSYRPGQRLRPFLTFGVGRERVRIDGPVEQTDPASTLGGGLRWHFTDKLGLRLDARYVRVSTSWLGNGTQGNLESSLGLLWTIGGAPPDEDGDGIRDRLDRCPGTPRRVLVDVRGCPVDGDHDGVPDGLDRCPGTPPGWRVDAEGCPYDEDLDGVADGEDHCPGTAAGASVDPHGCPADEDGDGVADDFDRCPGTPPGAAVDRSGCPDDTDGDGVLDGLDHCPGTPAGAEVNAAGCPSDTDGDGVLDGLDRCPATPPGSRVGTDGCPVLFEEKRRALVLEGVTFELDSARLTADARAVLDRVADSLKQWPALRVEIAGHTDSTGSSSHNLELSLRRAEAVRAYLIEAGVPSSWLTARGYGESRPVADDSTEQGRAENRRVELERLD